MNTSNSAALKARTWKAICTLLLVAAFNIAKINIYWSILSQAWSFTVVIVVIQGVSNEPDQVPITEVPWLTS